MPLALDNYLPAVELQFGSLDDDEICFCCHLDICAAMNTGNLLLHMWIMTKFPYLVSNFEQFDDPAAFKPISLDCAVPSAAADGLKNQLTAVVTYKTWYMLPTGQPALLSLGLGESIGPNAILGIPTLRSWQIIVNLSKNIAVSEEFNLSFPLIFEHAATGFPAGVTFK